MSRLFDAVKITLRPEWSSVSDDYRRKIREALYHAVAERGQDCPELLDLSIVPRVPGLTISIAHCELAGGFALAPSDVGQIGFDMEDSERVTATLIARVIPDPALRAGAPSPSHLWVALEATFKSLFGATQPLVVSQLSVLEWRQTLPTVWQFSFIHRDIPAIRGSGEIRQEKRLILGLALNST